MKIKKLYKHDNGKQIWRILPTSEKKLVIEERDIETKEVFFNCLEIEFGKNIFKNYQLEEKNWAGIETIYNNIIFFHTYGKPDMPAHKNIIAFDILSQTIIWQNDNYVFSFVNEDKVYCYQQRFESRVFYALDYLTGKVIEELGSDATMFNQIREKLDDDFENQNYLFPKYFVRTEIPIESHQKYLEQILAENVIKGDVSFLQFKNYLMYSYHEVNKSNTFDNIFVCVDLTKNKIQMKETLDKNLVNLMPESFFVKDNLLFLIVDKTKLLVYQIEE